MLSASKRRNAVRKRSLSTFLGGDDKDFDMSAMLVGFEAGATGSISDKNSTWSKLRGACDFVQLHDQAVVEVSGGFAQFDHHPQRGPGLLSLLCCGRHVDNGNVCS